MRIDIKNAQNITIGWLNDLGSQIQGQHRTKGIVGFYNKSTNITFYQSGKIYCYGDGVQCLVRMAEEGRL